MCSVRIAQCAVKPIFVSYCESIMSAVRRQLSLYLPEPERTIVDAIRSKFDPNQYRLIPAHVTLCRESEVRNWDHLWDCLETLGPVCIEFELGEPIRLPDGGILIGITGSTAPFDELRAFLLGESSPLLRPHITLVHPRNAGGKEGSLSEIQRERLPNSVTLSEVSLIEQVDGGQWTVLATH